MFERDEFRTTSGALDKRRVVPRMLQKRGDIGSDQEERLF
jgi:hypothetical protein